MLKDSDTLGSLGLNKGSKLFFKDLGPQVGYSTVSFSSHILHEEEVNWAYLIKEAYLVMFCTFQVFLTEYTGPLVLYLVFYLRPAIIYGSEAAGEPKAPVVQYVFTDSQLLTFT